MYLLIVFVLNMDPLDFLILIPNLCILWINVDLQIFIKSNGVTVGISRPSPRTWWLLLTLINLLKFLTFSPLSLHHITLNTSKDICSEY
jgi:hypothetical protein